MRKIIIINADDQKPINKVKNFIKKFFLIFIAIIAFIAIAYVAIWMTLIILAIAISSLVIFYIYVKFFRRY